MGWPQGYVRLTSNLLCVCSLVSRVLIAGDGIWAESCQWDASWQHTAVSFALIFASIPQFNTSFIAQ